MYLEALATENVEPPPQLHRVHALGHVSVVDRLLQVVAGVAPRLGVRVAQLARRAAVALSPSFRGPDRASFAWTFMTTQQQQRQ